MARDNKLDPSEITLQLVEAAPTIINMLNRTQAGKAAKYMEKHGVKIMTNSMITEVCEDHVNLKGKDPIPTYTLIWTAGVPANSTVKKVGSDTSPRGGEAAPTIINMLNRTQAGKAAKYMEKHGVKIMTNSMITEVCEDQSDGIACSLICNYSAGGGGARPC
ncbi:hypothetical protein WP50_10110 [Lactiplantibacillus plantarum]|nr:hypothetical protein WP50_10110 [Lactiplantibacillus plantarum]